MSSCVAKFFRAPAFCGSTGEKVLSKAYNWLVVQAGHNTSAPIGLFLHFLSPSELDIYTRAGQYEVS